MRTKYVGKWGKEAWVIGDIVNIYLLKQPYHVEMWRACSAPPPLMLRFYRSGGEAEQERSKGVLNTAKNWVGIYFFLFHGHISHYLCLHLR